MSFPPKVIFHLQHPSKNSIRHYSNNSAVNERFPYELKLDTYMPTNF